MSLLTKRLRSRRRSRAISRELHDIKEILIGCVGFAIVGAFGGWMMVNAILGCGEPTYYTDGTWITGHCWHVPWVNVERGTW